MTITKQAENFSKILPLSWEHLSLNVEHVHTCLYVAMYWILEIAGITKKMFQEQMECAIILLLVPVCLCLPILQITVPNSIYSSCATQDPLWMWTLL